MSESFYYGAASQSVDVFLGDSSSTTGEGLTGLVFNSAGLICYYRKGATGSATAITLATQTVGGAWSSGGFKEIDGTNMKGLYRFDIPNAVIDTEGFATIYFRGATNLAPTPLRIDCRPYPVDVKRINADATAASNLSLSSRTMVTGTIGVGSTTTSIVTSAISPAPAQASQFANRTIIFLRGTTTGELACYATTILSATNAALPTFTVVSTGTAPVSGDLFIIV